MKELLFLTLGLFIGYDFCIRTVPPELKPVIQIIELKKEVPQETKEVLVTAYSLSKKQCNKDLNNTATMVKPIVGMTAAVSRDNLFLLGKKIYVEGFGVRKVTDVMHERWENRIDLLVDKKTALRFDNKLAKVTIID